MMSTTENYLDEYRKRYGGLTSISERETALGSRSTASIDDLLSRYLEKGIVDRNGNCQVETWVSASMDLIDDKNLNHNNSSLDIKTTENATDWIGNLDINSSNSDEEIDDLLQFEQEACFLPTDSVNSKPPLTVDSLLLRQSQLSPKTSLSNGRRRYSHPTRGMQGQSDDNSHPKLKVSRSLSTATSTILNSNSNSNNNNSNSETVERSNSERNLKDLRRRESTYSNRSIESNNSRTSGKGDDLIDIGDEDLDYEFGEWLNSSLQSDSADGQKTINQLFSANRNVSDSISVTSSEEGDGCINCAPATTNSSTSVESSTSTCSKCVAKQIERHNTLKEILSSEESYCRDLVLIKEQLMDKLINQGLISSEEAAAIFSNLSQLIAVSEKFIEELKLHFQELTAKHDEKYNGALIGKLICESSAMFLAFEAYCLNQNQALSFIENLRKERELFNLFLEVSQTDNALLRRMDLKTFLMAPVQRVMKYPLLLQRLSKVTNGSHVDSADISSAIQKLTNILLHINTQANLFSSYKDIGPGKSKTSFEIALTKLCMDAVKWLHNEIHLLVSGKIGFLQPTESQLDEKIKNLRFGTAYAVIISNGKDGIPKSRRNDLMFCKSTRVKSAAVLLVKHSNSKLQLIREPFYLKECVISRHPEFYDVFFMQEKVKETFVVRPVHNSNMWYRYMKYFSLVLGGRNQIRRNALPNILLDA